MHRQILAVTVISVAAAPAMAQARYGRLPLAFEPNQGQSDPSVRYLARARGMAVFFTDNEAVMVLQGRAQQSVVRMKLVGAGAPRTAEGLDLLPGVSNYYLGNDPALWRAGVPHYGRIAMRGVYPGIDLVTYGVERRIEYDFIVAPDADPRRVQIAWEGVDGISVNGEGDLVLRTPGGVLTQKRPRVYQETGRGRVEVAARYVVSRERTVTFALARYDRRRPLVIDPQLVYSTYLGGSGGDQGFGIAVDSSGSAYVTGATPSANFPLKSSLKATPGSLDAFVTKLSPDGFSLVYSTFLGGGGNDKGLAIAVDSAGSAYVTGTTLATDFPVLTPLQTKSAGTWDVFVTKLASAGTLAYSTYLGGNDVDTAQGIAVDSTGAAYVTGATLSTNFPTQSPFQSAKKGDYDAFVAKISPSGSSLVYSTYLGGASTDQAWAIAVDSAGSAYITGDTISSDFPTISAYQAAVKSRDVFVTKLSPSGSSLAYSTFVGGSGSENAYGIAVDSTGAAYVAGRSQSGDFPTVGAYQPKPAGNSDIIVFKLAPAGNSLVYSTYVGGKGNDYAYAIAIDGLGSAYVAGYTESTDFPTVSSFQTDQGLDDAIVFKLSPAGDALVYATYLGGASNDYAQGIALDPTTAAYVTGYTDSTDFPTRNPIQTDQTSTDAFVTKIDVLITGASKAQLISPTAGSKFTNSTVTFTWTSVAGATAYGLAIGQGPENFNLYQKEQGLSTSVTVSGLPTDGSTIWVRLITQISGALVWNNYTFTAIKIGAKAVITSPTPGTVLPGSTVTFTWTAASGATTYWLSIGTVAGGVNLFDQSEALATSQTVNGLPTDGSTVYVRLWTAFGDIWQFNDYTFKASGGSSNAILTSPAPGSTLNSSAVTFGWTAGTGATSYWLDVGTAHGSNDLFNRNEGLAKIQTVSGLPTDGSTVYVRLWTARGSVWQFNDYSYTTTPRKLRARILLPSPGSKLSGASVTFSWSAGSLATAYALDVGNAQGLNDIFSSYTGLATSQNVGGIPTAGQIVTVGGFPTSAETVWVRLWTAFGSVWQFWDYQYKVFGTNAEIVSPTPGSSLTGANVTFTWSAAPGASEYWLSVGSAAGANDIYSKSQGLSTSATISGLPTNGATLYVRLTTHAGFLWPYNDYTYKAAWGDIAYILTPAPAATLGGTSATFTWSAASGASGYWLDIGTVAGGNDLYSRSQGTATSATVGGLPTGGVTVYVRLWTIAHFTFQYLDYFYTAAP
jgi:hypothetical protein